MCHTQTELIIIICAPRLDIRIPQLLSRQAHKVETTSIQPKFNVHTHNVETTKLAHNVEATSSRRWFNILMLNQPLIDFVSTLCARWERRFIVD